MSDISDEIRKISEKELDHHIYVKDYNLILKCMNCDYVSSILSFKSLCYTESHGLISIWQCPSCQSKGLEYYTKQIDDFKKGIIKEEDYIEDEDDEDD